MSNILITGINGFVGSNLVNTLSKQNHKISGLSRVADSSKSIFSWEELDTTFNNFDIYIHLAGKAHDLKMTSNPQEYFDVNTDLTIKLFDLFLKSNAITFIYMSSVKAVADTVEDVLRESDSAHPITPYGQSKQQAEQYILKATPSNKRVFILRPCMIHGPGNKGNLTLLYNLVKKGVPYPLAAFKNKRSFLSVANLAYIIEKIISVNSVPAGVYNLADDLPLSTNEVLKIMAEVGGFKQRLWRVNTTIIKFLASLGDVLRLPLNSEKLKKLTESYVVSNQKIKDAIQIQQFPISSTDGLKITIKTFQNN